MANNLVQDPNTPKYDKVSGLLTDYGKSLGLSEVNKTNTITSDVLSGSGKSLTLPDPAVPAYGGLPGATEGLVVGAKTSADKNLELLKTNVSETGNAYLKELLGSAGISSSVDRAAENAAKIESDKYLSQLEQEQLSNRRVAEDLTKNFKGTTTGLSSAVAAKNRESLSKQADIAILYTSANRSYDTAKSIADRAVEMKLEESKIKLSALKFFYDENKDAFDKADDRLYSETIKKADREYKKQEEIENKIRDLKLNVAQYAGSSASGILSKLSAIDTTKAGAFDEAAKIAGKYASDPLDRELKRAQIDSANRSNRPSAEAPITKEIDGKTMQWDPKTNGWISPTVSGGGVTDPAAVEKSNDDIKQIKNLASNKIGINSSAGMFQRHSLINTNKVNDWRANVKNVLSQTTLAELVRVKGSGVTFGALSEGERQAVADASTALNAAMEYEGEGENKTPTGRFKASESFVEEKLGLIQKYAEIDFKKRNGMSSEDYEAKKYIDSISPALETISSPYSSYLAPGQFNN